MAVVAALLGLVFVLGIVGAVEVRDVVMGDGSGGEVAEPTWVGLQAERPPPGVGRRVGFSAGDLVELDGPALERRVLELRRTGVGWVRIDVSWARVEKRPNSYDWSEYDRVVVEVRRQGLSVLGLLDYAPAWQAAPGCRADQECSPRDAAGFAAFAEAAVRRYGPHGVRHWEVWNEPNLPAFWGPAPSVPRYVDLLKATYTAVKRADAGATVILGGLGVTYTEGTRIGSLDFLSRVYALGGRPYFDAVAHHSYSFPADPTVAHSWSGWTQMLAVRKKMVAEGDARKKVWITEFGAPTGGPGHQATPQDRKFRNHPDHVSETLQRTIAEHALAAHATYAWAGPLFWYCYADLGTARTTNENFFGLVRADGSRKPAFGSFVTAVGRLPVVTY